MSEQFSKQSIGWHRDARCRALKHPAYKWLNSVLWSLCVEHRTETLPEYIKATDIAYESGIDVRTVRKGLTFMSTLVQPLIKVLDNGQIHVYGVREMHETHKFQFKSTIDINEDICEDTNEDIDEDINVLIDAEESEDRVEKSRVEKKKIEKNDDPLIEEISTFYKSQINSKLIPTGIKNLKVLHKKSKISFKDLFQRVKNYKVEVDRDGIEFRYQMSNFFGKAEYHINYLEVPETGPQNAPKNNFNIDKDKDYGSETIRRL